MIHSPVPPTGRMSYSKRSLCADAPVAGGTYSKSARKNEPKLLPFFRAVFSDPTMDYISTLTCEGDSADDAVDLLDLLAPMADDSAWIQAQGDNMTESDTFNGMFTMPLSGMSNVEFVDTHLAGDAVVHRLSGRISKRRRGGRRFQVNVRCSVCGAGGRVVKNLGGATRETINGPAKYRYHCQASMGGCGWRFLMPREPNADGSFPQTKSNFAIGDEKKRCNYKCGKCGQDKSGHVCTGLKRADNLPNPTIGRRAWWEPDNGGESGDEGAATLSALPLPAAIASSTAPVVAPPPAAAEQRDEVAVEGGSRYRVGCKRSAATDVLEENDIAEAPAAAKVAAPHALERWELDEWLASAAEDGDSEVMTAEDSDDEVPLAQLYERKAPSSAAAKQAELATTNGSGVDLQCVNASSPRATVHLTTPATGRAPAVAPPPAPAVATDDAPPPDDATDDAQLPPPSVGNLFACGRQPRTGNAVIKGRRLVRYKVKGDGSCWVYAMLACAGLCESRARRREMLPTPRDRGMDRLCRVLSHRWLSHNQGMLTEKEKETLDDVKDKRPQHPMVDCDDGGSFGTIHTIMGLAAYFDVSVVCWNATTLSNPNALQQVATHMHDAERGLAMSESVLSVAQIWELTARDARVMHIEWNGTNHYCALVAPAPVPINAITMSMLKVHATPIAYVNPKSFKPATKTMPNVPGWIHFVDRIRSDIAHLHVPKVHASKPLEQLLQRARDRNHHGVSYRVSDTGQHTVWYIRFAQKAQLTVADFLKTGDYSSNLYVDERWQETAAGAMPPDAHEEDCPCRTRFLKVTTSIPCEECHRWFHQTCVGVNDEDVDGWRCADCAEYGG